MSSRERDESAQPVSEELARVLDAARAPGHPQELQGAQRPLEMLRANPLAAPRRLGRAMDAMRAASLATKIAIAALLAVVFGGTVVAGATGHLPGQHRPQPRPQPATSTHHGSASPRTGHPSRSGTPSASASASASASGSPSSGTSSPTSGSRTPTSSSASASPTATSPSRSTSAAHRSSAPHKSPPGTRTPITTR